MIPKVFFVPRMKPVECFLPIQTFLPWVIIQQKTHHYVYNISKTNLDSKHTRPPKRLNTLRVEWAPLKIQFTSIPDQVEGELAHWDVFLPLEISQPRARQPE